METALESNSEKVSPELSADFVFLFSGCDQTDVPPFMKLFWEEQQKYVQSSSKSSIRYHPMIIKYCLNLAAKSSSTYSNLRYDSKSGSGILLLASLRTLRASNQQEDLIQQASRSLPSKHLHFNQWKDLCPLYLMK